MSRRVAVTEERQATAYRVVRVTVTPEGRKVVRYIGLFDTPAPARALVTRTRKAAETGRPLNRVANADPWGAESSEGTLSDVWTEPVTLVNHPDVRYTDDWKPADEAAERMGAISSIASVLEDGPPDTWKLAHAIRRLADREFTVAQAWEWLGDEWVPS